MTMHILVTAGPTREFLDPVRFLSNRSTGRMGYAVAVRALARGHAVTLVSGPVALKPPEGAVCIPVITALEMLAAVQAFLPTCDALVMTAAVADWRPRTTASAKLKKRSMNPCLELEPNPDILLTVRPLKESRIFVGFAAETDNVLAEAEGKLASKGLDLLVANDVSQPDAGFEVETNRVVFLAPGEPPRPLPLLPKLEVADAILDWLERRADGNFAVRPSRSTL